MTAPRTPASNAKTLTVTAAVAAAVGLTGGLFLHTPAHPASARVASTSAGASASSGRATPAPSSRATASSSDDDGFAFGRDDDNGGRDGLVLGGRAQPSPGLGAGPQTSSHGS